MFLQETEAGFFVFLIIRCTISPKQFALEQRKEKPVLRYIAISLMGVGAISFGSAHRVTENLITQAFAISLGLMVSGLALHYLYLGAPRLLPIGITTIVGSLMLLIGGTVVGLAFPPFNAIGLGVLTVSAIFTVVGYLILLHLPRGAQTASTA